MANEPVQLPLSAEAVGRYCRAVPRTARDTAHALNSLVAVQTFLAAVAPPGLQAGSEYQAVRCVLQDRIAELQAKLLDESAARLGPALVERKLEEIAKIHAALSRSGFRDALAIAFRRLGPGAIVGIGAWVTDWCHSARTRAEAASGYPEAFDFRAAGIPLQTYAALNDADNILKELGY